jgi:hypothetical protein
VHFDEEMEEFNAADVGASAETAAIKSLFISHNGIVVESFTQVGHF